MIKIRGTMEYPDGYTPGRKADGGLSQNLYQDGNLRAHASFQPDKTGRGDFSTEWEWTAESAEKLAALLTLAFGIAPVAAPVVKSWWSQTVQPALSRLYGRVRGWRRSKEDQLEPEAAPESSTGMLAQASTEVSRTIDEALQPTSTQEAEQRLVAAFWISAYIASQRDLLRGARNADPEGVAQLERAIKEFSAPEVIEHVNRILRDCPSLLGDGQAEAFLRLFGAGGTIDGAYSPITQDVALEALSFDRLLGPAPADTTDATEG
jgi:hypothetical protein